MNVEWLAPSSLNQVATNSTGGVRVAERESFRGFTERLPRSFTLSSNSNRRCSKSVSDTVSKAFFDLYAQDAASEADALEAKYVDILRNLSGFSVLVHASFDRIVELETEVQTLRRRLRQTMGLEPWHDGSPDEG